MLIKKRIICAIALVTLAFFQAAFAITITVAKTGADCKTINEALGKAQAGDIIKIMDANTYEEQVTIDSNKCPLTLTSKDPTSLNKPVIKFQDITHVGPRTAAESKIDSLINFDQNGAIRIIKARNVIIDGIAVDGGGVKPFGYPSIWESRYGLQHGNAAITVWVSGDIVIRNCDLSNAYFGINFKDRNLGGIFASPNPADLDTANNVPLSGFALTGNHLVERCRIHNNSWGMFFESSWDLGTTIRYNLIYENHHPTAAIATAVKGLTSDEGGNQPGGAFFFKDDELSPVAIYNNTLYQNFALFAGHWQAGYQHLIFNNIFGPPNDYWSTATPQFNTESMDLTPVLLNRIYSCTFSAQVQAPQATYVRILGGSFPQLQGAGGVAPDPGTLLSGVGGFPATANNKWLEMGTTTFLSLNPASENFLEPNWADESVKACIVNQGWEKSGVTNTDGSRADLGAIEQARGKQPFVATIKPSPLPIILNGTTASITFTLDEREGTTLTDPEIKLFRLVRMKFVKQTPFGSNEKSLIIAASDMTDLTVPTTPPVKVGPNSYSVSANITGDFAFIEMIVQAKGADGKLFTSAVGFIPYRKLEYIFKVEVLDKPGGKVIQETRVADTVTLRITPQKIGGTAFTNQVNPVQVTLISGFELLDASKNPAVELEYPSGVTGPTERQVIFTKIPEGNIENIAVAGKYTNPSTKSALPFIGGTSIKVLSGPPEIVQFVNPPSNSRKLIPPVLPAGYAYPCTLLVYDKYGNIVNSPAQVVVQSLTPTLANVVGGKPDTIITTNAEGVGAFRVKTENAAREDMVVKFMGNVSGKTLTDTADMVVGARAEHLFIFYSDLQKYDPTTELRGQVGDRLKITVIATKAETPTIDSILIWPATFTISGSNSKMLFYESPTATTATNSFKLDNGKVEIWVSSADTLNNASVSTRSDDIIASQPRDQIYFTRPIVSVDSAFYYANNGNGQVDSVEIYYKKPLAMIPDSIVLYWPLKIDSLKRVVTGTNPAMRLSADSMHVTISLKANPFPAEMTGARSAERFGITYNRPNTNPGVQESSLTFPITDKVGPLLMVPAEVVERISEGAGIDTFTVNFSEPITPSSLSGEALLLIQNGKPSELTIQSYVAKSSTQFKLVVASKIKPQFGDSLRINPQGMIIDSVGNFAHALNRPIPLKVRTVPGGIEYAYYIDNQDQKADGVVDSVILKFNKKVHITDMDVSLEWTGTGGSNKADHIATSFLGYINGDSMLVEVYVRGQFSGLLPTAVRTAGSMKATVKYTSLDETVLGDVFDSTALVCVDSAMYRPGSRPENGQDRADTLYVTFSEPVVSMSNSLPKPFFTENAQTGIYTLNLTLPWDALEWTNNVDKWRYRFIVPPGGISFPKNGDSLWIDPISAIKEAGGSVQDNRVNRKVVMHVFPIPYDYIVTVSESPFTPAPNKKLAIRIKPKTRMLEQVDLVVSGKIYDGLGNVLYSWADTKFDQNVPDHLENGLPMFWDCTNLNKRTVGSGVYIASMSITVKKEGYVTENRIKKIGVKR